MCNKVEIFGALWHAYNLVVQHFIQNINNTFQRNSILKLFSACQLEKSYRLPLTNVHYSSPNPFDIVHVDLWGNSLIVYVNNMKYFILFFDDYTCFQWLYVLNNKRQVAHLFLHFVSMVER